MKPSSRKIAEPTAVAAVVAKTARTRVFLVDDHAFVRKGVKTLVDSCPDLVVCGEAATASEAMARLAEARAAIAVVDISLPGANGIDLIRDMAVRFPGVAVVVLSMHDENTYAERVLRAGAQGYVMKQDPPERLIEGIRTVLKGELFVGERLKASMLAAFFGRRPRGEQKLGADRLSDRELQVFEAIGRGLATSQIAKQSNLSTKTVETYRSNIKKKLGLDNGNQLVHAAVRWVDAETAGGRTSLDSGEGVPTADAAPLDASAG